ncbi:MAG: substrate-binding domain-containing protein [Spirochaetales bacterium]|nr:substrate-binding domain-containing protein [Spirochaetales bacterium]
MENRFKSVAFLSRGIEDTVGGHIWQGMYNYAREHNINLYCFRAGVLGKDPASMLYQVIDAGRYDSFATWASTAVDDTTEYYRRFDKKPFLSISLKLPETPVVSIDNVHGIREVIEHLITQHHFNKIAFIRGPENHVYAQERFKAYKQTLERHGIPIDDNLITPPGTWAKSTGIDGVQLFFDKRNKIIQKDIQAIVCCNDTIAIGSIEELTRRGLRIPDELAVVGYNDTKEGRCMNPPLTSVAMPFIQQGYTSARLLDNLMQGLSIDNETHLPAQMVLGQSCGCQSQIVKGAAVNKPVDMDQRQSLFQCFLDHIRGEKQKTGAPQAIAEVTSIDTIVQAMTKSVEENMPGSNIETEFFHDQSLILIESFTREIEEKRSGYFLSRLSEVLRRLVDKNIDLDVLHRVISVMRSAFLELLKEQNLITQSEDLWGQARVMIGETALRFKEFGYLQIVQQEHILRDIGSKLITTYDLAKLMDILAEELPGLMIPGCYIVLYDRARISLTATGEVPPTSRLIFGYNEKGRLSLTADGMRFPTKELLPEIAVDTAAPHVHVIHSLFFNELQIGYVVFEVGPTEGIIYDSLRTQLSSSFYGALLLKERAEVRQLLEITLAAMQHKASIVSDRSKSISDHVTESSASMEQLSASVKEISKNIRGVMDIVTESVTLTQSAHTDITNLKTQSTAIDDIVGLISEIAEKTKILALNASIEAARAGEAGKGFSLVAREVKELAYSTVSSTEKIAEMIKKIHAGTKMSAEAITRVKEIISRVSDLSAGITIAITEQEKATSDVSNLLVNAAQGSREITEAISEVAELGKETQENFLSSDDAV